MSFYLESHDIKDCSGCGACDQICPVSCIEMTKNEEGFLYPTVDESRCIHCDLCRKVCPFTSENKNKNMSSPKDAYACWSNNNEILIQSSSGGIFSEIAEFILSENGVVFGAELNKDRTINHVKISSIEDLKRIRGSKYIQSDTLDTFSEAKRYLKSGTKVLFSGTPCQVAGLKLFLGKSYDNLSTIDFICHGVPSPHMFQEYVKSLEKKHHGTLTKVVFRDKIKNGWSITLRYDIKKRNQKIKSYFLNRRLSSYFNGFLNGSILQEACYNCPFTKSSRVGDVTLADFWGYKSILPNITSQMGLSLAFVNTQNGSKIISTIEENIVKHKITVEQAMVENNTNLFHPTPRPKIRDTIYNELDLKGYRFIEKQYLLPKYHILTKIRFMIPKNVRNKIKKVIGVE